MWGNTTAKQKPCGENTITIHNVIFKKNYKAKFSTSSIWKKIKSTKTNLKKIIKTKEKNLIEKYCSNLLCFKEKNYVAKFSTSSIFKKISKNNFAKKNKKKGVNFEK